MELEQVEDDPERMMGWVNPFSTGASQPLLSAARLRRPTSPNWSSCLRVCVLPKFILGLKSSDLQPVPKVVLGQLSLMSCRQSGLQAAF